MIHFDRQKYRTYLKDTGGSQGLTQAWDIRHTIDLATQTDFYLRSEEFTAQPWYCCRCFAERCVENVNSFERALKIGEVITLLQEAGERKGGH